MMRNIREKGATVRRTIRVETRWIEATLLGLVVSLSVCLPVRAAATRSRTAPPPRQVTVQSGVGHEFICTDDTQGKVFIVSEKGRIEWEYPAPHANDIWALDSNDFLFSIRDGLMRVTRDKEVLNKYLTKGAIYGLQLVPIGYTFFGECDTGRLIEINGAGIIQKEIRLLPKGEDGGPDYMRCVRLLSNDRYLVAHYGLDVVREYDGTGKVVREIPAAGGPYCAIRLPDGNTLIGCGDRPGGARIFEVDRDNKTVWQVQGDELPGVSLKFVTGFQRLFNGNTVLCNWLGHNRTSRAPHVIEVTRDKQVVWTFFDHVRIKTITSLQLLDVPGDPTTGDIWH